jgi:hypothetical protein
MSKKEQSKRPKLKGTWVNVTDVQVEETNKIFETILMSTIRQLNKEVEELNLSNKDNKLNGN